VKSDVRNVSTVQTLEGSETYISIGQAVPVRTTHVMPGRRGPTLRRSTAYVDVASGFYATARLSGDQVTLEISPQQQRLQPGQAGGSIQSRGLSSTVTGRLGEWIELGAVREQSSESTAGVLVWGRRSEESAYSAFVRVEALP
jgi:type II secretory pathway component GspD/PulD (secretin)